jgi:hypothetical protein
MNYVPFGDTDYSRGDNCKRVDLRAVEFIGDASITLGGQPGVAIITEKGEEILLSLRTLQNIIQFAKGFTHQPGMGVIVKFSERDPDLIGKPPQLL